MMFIRSKDGKHLAEVHSVDLEGSVILVNGSVFAEYDSEMEALGAFVALNQECSDCDAYFDLAGEIASDYDDDDDFDYDDDEDNDGMNFIFG